MFKCKACESHKAHLADLRDEIAHLRSMAFATSNPFNEPIVNREANAVLDGTTSPLTFSTNVSPDDANDRKAYEEEITERDRILSGNYS